MKKNGFTLIELLAVIIILAIIALIAVPLIINIIGKVKDKADLESINRYINKVELDVTNKNLDENFNPKRCNVEEDGNLNCDGTKLDISIKGSKPNGGYLELDNWKVTEYLLYLNGKEYSNIKTTPDECFIVDVSGTIYGYTCDYKDVIIPRKMSVRTVESATVNKDKCLTFVQEQGIEDSEQACNDLASEIESIPKIELTRSIVSSNEILPILDIKYTDKIIESATVNKDRCLAFEDSEWCNKTTKELETMTKEELNYRINSGFYRVEVLDIKYSNEGKSVEVKTIGDQAFRNRGLTSVKIPDSVTTIEGSSDGSFGAFSNNQLTSVEIPDSVEEIGVYAFSSNQLTDVKLGKNVKRIGADSFGNNKLKSIKIPDSVEFLSGFNDNQLTSVEIPNGVKKIWWNAFSHNQLKSITIPSSVEFVSGFNDNQLTDVKIPSSVTTIDRTAFGNNPNLKLTIEKPKDSISGSPWGASSVEWTG